MKEFIKKFCIELSILFYLIFFCFISDKASNWWWFRIIWLDFSIYINGLGSISISQCRCMLCSTCYLLPFGLGKFRLLFFKFWFLFLELPSMFTQMLHLRKIEVGMSKWCLRNEPFSRWTIGLLMPNKRNSKANNNNYCHLE